MTSAKASLASSVVIGPSAPTAGSWICVPPSNSMPRLKPLMPIVAMQARMSAPKKTNHRLRWPTMSNAPVPV